MNNYELMKSTVDLSVLLVISGLLLWSDAGSTSPASKVCSVLSVSLISQLILCQESDEMQESEGEMVTLYRDVNRQVARTKKTRKGRCLLSLGKSPYIVIICWLSHNTGSDGGGIFALSQIVILYEISNRIMHDLGLHEPPRLCDYFDMIGGVGTGGYAIQWQ
jgi:hypothetical protein